jgi:hypothetical protein
MRFSQRLSTNLLKKTRKRSKNSIFWLRSPTFVKKIQRKLIYKKKGEIRILKSNRAIGSKKTEK